LRAHKVEKLPIFDQAGKLRGLITVKDFAKSEQYPNATKDDAGRLRVAAAVGVGEESYARAMTLVEAGVDFLIVDTAHGHSQGVLDAVARIREALPDVQRLRPEVSSALAAVLDRATAKDLQRRYLDASSLVADLEDVLAIETARAGQATGEATTVLRTLPGEKRRRVPLRARVAPALAAAILLLALAGTAMAGSFLPWAASAVLLGAGTAMVYPTLLAAIGDVAHPSWRATAVGVYRLWRDSGFALGALLAGVVADLAGLEAAVWVVAALTAASGLVVAGRMYETHRPVGQP
jgi:hypothetical protein